MARVNSSLTRRRAVDLPELGVGVHQEGVHLGGQVEDHPAGREERVSCVGGSGARAEARDQTLELPLGLALSGVEPLGLGLRRSDSGQLPSGAPGLRAGGQRPLQLGEALQGPGDPELLFGEARAVTQSKVGVLDERREAQVFVDPGRKRREEAAADLLIEGALPLGQGGEFGVDVDGVSSSHRVHGKCVARA
jgi:hypothetical protein